MAVLEHVVAANKEYSLAFDRSKLGMPPAKKAALVVCMDARLTVEEFTGLKTGDVHIIRNAGGLVTDDALRSLVISTEVLGTEEIFVVNHTDCGMMAFSPEELRDKVRSRIGKEPESGVGQPFTKWLGTFKDLKENVKAQVQKIKDSPLIRDDIRVYGFIYHVESGVLERVV